jgi:hypothetical protein
MDDEAVASAGFRPAKTLPELRERYPEQTVSVRAGQWRARTESGKRVSEAYSAPSLERSILAWLKGS